MQHSPANQALGRRLLIASAAGHNVILAAILLAAIFLIAACLAIVLVSLARRDDRVDAIHATAGILRALLPWHDQDRSPGPDDIPPPGPRAHDDD